MSGGHRVGAHVSIAGGLERAIERGAATGCDVIQIFTRSNQKWRARPIGRDEVARWRERRAALAVEPVMVHACYLLNLAAPRAPLRERSYRALRLELDRADLLGIPYLVFHPGAHCGDGEAAGIARIAAALDRLHEERPDARTRVLLENTAGQGTSIGWRFEHLRDILGAMKSRRARARVGLCIDTCHTLAAGYDITTPEGWARTTERLDAAVGCTRVAAFHVNDSRTPLGSRVDRHEQLGQGHLGLAGLRALLADPRFCGLPMVIETPRPDDAADRKNLAVLRRLASKRTEPSRSRRPSARRRRASRTTPRRAAPAGRGAGR